MSTDAVAARLDRIENILQDYTVQQKEYSYLDTTSMASEEMDLRDLWLLVWQKKWSLSIFVVLLTALATIYAVSLPNIYKSEALLAPAESKSGGVGIGLGQLGGLASLAGVNIDTGANDKTTFAIQVLKSREFIYKFIEKHQIMVPLIASKGWDKKKNELILDSTIFDESKKKWAKEYWSLNSEQPSSLHAYRAFMRLLSISQDAKTNFVTLSIEFFSPNVAKQWVDWLIQDINHEIKLRDVAEAEHSIDYLQNQLAETSIADMRSVFYELIEGQTKTIMFSKVRDEYVFKTVDRAIVPETKVKPKRALISLCGFIFAVTSYLLILFSYHFFCKNNRSKVQ